MADEQGLEFKVSGTGTVKKAGPVLRGHVVCRRPDGTIRWEADTVPVTLAIGVGDELTVTNPITLKLAPDPDPGEPPS